KIDDPVAHKRPTIVDPNKHRTLVRQIRHPDHGAERKRTMRRGELVHVKNFSVRSLPALIFFAVVRSGAGLYCPCGGGGCLCLRNGLLRKYSSRGRNISVGEKEHRNRKKQEHENSSVLWRQGFHNMSVLIRVFDQRRRFCSLHATPCP